MSHRRHVLQSDYPIRSGFWTPVGSTGLPTPEIVILPAPFLTGSERSTVGVYPDLVGVPRMPLRGESIEDSDPVGKNLSPFPSNAFIFSQFRTLLRNGGLTTPFPSITSALFPVQRRGRGSHSSPNFQMRFVHPARCVGTFKSGFGIPHASSRRSTFKRNLSPLECALSIPRRMRIVPAPFPPGSEHRESKDLNSRLTPLECAFTKNRGVRGAKALNLQLKT
jgi:hypothetical protein